MVALGATTSAMLLSTSHYVSSSNCSLNALLPLCPRSTSSSFCVGNKFLYLPSLDLQRLGARRSKKLVAFAVQKTPKGFGKAPAKKKESKQDGSLRTGLRGGDEDEDEDEQQQEAEDDVVPEVVTNRMLKRIIFTVGIPSAIGVAFFVLYYYLKAVKKVDLPEWLPLFTSFLTFGSAGAGITYGVLSASWDPVREGSMLGWKEAQLNWPVFWQTLRGKGDGKSR